jgi:copper chaperone NosL
MPPVPGRVAVGGTTHGVRPSPTVLSAAPRQTPAGGERIVGVSAGSISAPQTDQYNMSRSQELLKIAPSAPPVPGLPLAPAELGVEGGARVRPLGPRILRGVLLGLAGFLVGAAVFFPLWELRVVTPDGPQGIELLVFAGRLAGQTDAVNTVNRSIGMRELVSPDIREFRVVPALLGLAALACFVALFLRWRWAAAVPLGLLLASAVYGVRGLTLRLREFGGDLDPAAPAAVGPFTPPLLGAQQVGEFVTHAQFSWGTFLPALAAALVLGALLLDLCTPGRIEA